ncbi:unnamed protein product [Colias eurytheme]|nr:unnamed protein product [Colias eurytheme]
MKGNCNAPVPAGEPGVVVLRPEALAPDSESEGEDEGRPPSPCSVRFVNDNVLINGRSSMLARTPQHKQRAAKLKLQFDDSLTRTFEYPSETSMCEESPSRPDAAPNGFALNSSMLNGSASNDSACNDSALNGSALNGTAPDLPGSAPPGQHIATLAANTHLAFCARVSVRDAGSVRGASGVAVGVRAVSGVVRGVSGVGAGSVRGAGGVSVRRAGSLRRPAAPPPLPPDEFFI